MWFPTLTSAILQPILYLSAPPPPAIPTGPVEPPLFYPDNQRPSLPFFEPLLGTEHFLHLHGATCSKLHKALRSLSLGDTPSPLSVPQAPDCS